VSVTANNPLASHLKAVTDTIKLYDKFIICKIKVLQVSLFHYTTKSLEKPNGQSFMKVFGIS